MVDIFLKEKLGQFLMWHIFFGLEFFEVLEHGLLIDGSSSVNFPEHSTRNEAKLCKLMASHALGISLKHVPVPGPLNGAGKNLLPYG